MKQFSTVLLISFSLMIVINEGSCRTDPRSAANVAYEIYETCLSDLSTSCIKPKALSWLSKVIDEKEIRITDDLSIIKTGSDEPSPADYTSEERGYKDTDIVKLFDKIDGFLSTHSLKFKAPEALKSEEARSFIPGDFLKGGLAEDIEIPLTEGNVAEGRGFVRKVMVPFLLGVKFKTFVLVPIALALIALKTWKAMTFGLLSLVLSAALVIFKIAKPKVVNYEVVHYPHHHVDHIEHIPHHIEHFPHHVEHIPHHIEHIPHHIEHVPHHIDHVPHHIEHVPHHVEHHVEHANHHVEHVDHPPAWEPHGWARQFEEAQQMAYNGQIPEKS